MADVAEMQRSAQELRLSIIKMIYKAGSGHSGGSLSMAEIITVLYDEFLSFRPEEPLWPGRDRFILSKGHGAPALYATLARKGIIPPEELGTLRQLNSCLQGHPCMFKLPGVEMSTGSLGMGISVGIGMALAAKLQGKSHRVFVLCGDGELQEGQNWEALMSAAKWRPDNLVVIIDKNRVQLDGTVDEVMPMGDLKSKMEAFGFVTLVCDGHDVTALRYHFAKALELKAPVVILAETVKGKGVSFMEGKAAWHGKPIGKEEYEQAVEEISKSLSAYT